MSEKNKKNKRRKINLKPILYLLVILIPVISYFFFVFKHTKLFMLDSAGYSYIWFWNILSSGKILPMQSTIPRPLLVFFYGLLATPNLSWIEILKVFVMISLGYGVYKLSYRITESYVLSLFTEVLVFLIPVTIKNAAFGTDAFITAAFAIWALYFYIEEHYYLVSLLLLLGGLIRPETWVLLIFLIIHNAIAFKKFRFSLLIGILSPFLWFAFDFFLTKDPFYSFRVLNHYFSITGTPMLSHEKVLNAYYATFLSNLGIYLSIALLLSMLFSFLKRRYETILLVTTSLIILAATFISSFYTGFFREAYVLLPSIILIILIPFFLQSIFSFTYEAIPPLVFIGLVGITGYFSKNRYSDMINYMVTEKNKQETCRQMAPQVSVIDDKIVLMPYRRIGMFAYLNRKDYTSNILSERDMVARGFTLQNLNYIVYITDDFDRCAGSILTPLLDSNGKDEDIIHKGDIVIQKLYTTPNGLGKIFKVFVLKESEQGPKNRVEVR